MNICNFFAIFKTNRNSVYIFWKFIIINTQILTISQYEYPITQTLVLIVAVVIGQIAITVFVNRYIHKQSLVERMRD